MEVFRNFFEESNFDSEFVYDSGKLIREEEEDNECFWFSWFIEFLFHEENCLIGFFISFDWISSDGVGKFNGQKIQPSLIGEQIDENIGFMRNIRVNNSK